MTVRRGLVRRTTPRCPRRRGSRSPRTAPPTSRAAFSRRFCASCELRIELGFALDAPRPASRLRSALGCGADGLRIVALHVRVRRVRTAGGERCGEKQCRAAGADAASGTGFAIGNCMIDNLRVSSRPPAFPRSAPGPTNSRAARAPAGALRTCVASTPSKLLVRQCIVDPRDAVFEIRHGEARPDAHDCGLRRLALEPALRGLRALEIQSLRLDGGCGRIESEPLRSSRRARLRTSRSRCALLLRLGRLPAALALTFSVCCAERPHIAITAMNTVTPAAAAACCHFTAVRGRQWRALFAAAGTPPSRRAVELRRQSRSAAQVAARGRPGWKIDSGRSA